MRSLTACFATVLQVAHLHPGKHWEFAKAREKVPTKPLSIVFQIPSMKHYGIARSNR